MPVLVNVGDVLAGKYRVDKVLGVGGMGMVVGATHLELDQRVAIKFMLPDAVRVPQAMERFLREAKAVVKLRGEHICRVFDVGRLEDGAPYTVMEYLEGQDFADLLADRGSLPVTETIDLLLQAIEGVAEAHANQIVHRDLKPANLFISTEADGSPLVKVLDFGISKSSVAGASTKTGDVMGSPSYMAPEQLMSTKNVDARADIWALGVIIYQALTGELPFEADALPALCMSVIHDAPRTPSEVQPALPDDLSKIVMRCLEKNPKERFSDVAVLAAALAPYGSPEARVAAARLQKMLLRASGPAVALSDEKNTPHPPRDQNTANDGRAGQLAAAPVAKEAPASHTTPRGPEQPTIVAAAAPPTQQSTTLGSSNGQLTMAKPRQSKLPIVFALVGAAMLAVVVVGLMMNRGSKPAPVAAPQAATVAPPPSPGEPLAAPTRRKPKLQVTQLSEGQDAKPTETKAAATSAGSGSTVAAIAKTPGPTAAEPAPSKTGTSSIASLFRTSGIFGTWVAARLGDEYLVTNFGPTATLQITSTPSGASVTYENAEIGTTPLSIKVDRGGYEILIDLALEGHVDRSVNVWAMFDGTTQVHMPVPVALKLLSKPIGAEVEANGEVIGKTPLEIKVAPDEAQAFTLRLENYEDKVVDISVAKAGTETVVLERKLQQIVHEIDSVPTGAEVVLEGNVIGKTPMKTEFLEERDATRQYTLRMPGDQQRYKETALRVPADKPLKRVVKMRDTCATRAAEEDTGRPTLVNPYDPCRGVK